MGNEDPVDTVLLGTLNDPDWIPGDRLEDNLEMVEVVKDDVEVVTVVVELVKDEEVISLVDNWCLIENDVVVTIFDAALDEDRGNNKRQLDEPAREDLGVVLTPHSFEPLEILRIPPFSTIVVSISESRGMTAIESKKKRK